MTGIDRLDKKLKQ